MPQFVFHQRNLTGVSRRQLLTAGGALAAAASMRPLLATGQPRIEVTPGGTQAIPIAITDFVAGSANEGDTPRNMSGIITSNLKRSGLFAPIDPAAFIQKVVDFEGVPRFPDWKAINAAGLVTGRTTRQPDGRLRVEFRLWDVYA